MTEELEIIGGRGGRVGRNYGRVEELFQYCPGETE